MAPPADGAVVVLGGTGFIGQHLCTAFAAAGRDVLAMARRPLGRPLGCRFLPLDLAQDPIDVVAKTLDVARPAIVVNATGTTWDPVEEDMVATFTVPTRRLIRAFGLMSCRPRLVHLGSVLEHGPAAPGQPVGAATGSRPLTPYGRAKLAATRAVLAAAVDAVVLRIANAAGPGMPEISLLGRVAGCLVREQGRSGVAVVEMAPLRAYRDYVDVRDVADAVLMASTATVSGRAIDIGRGEAVSVRSIVDMLIAASGVRARVVEVGGVPDARDGVDWLRVDPRPALEVLGWRPRRSLLEAVRAVWEDALVNSKTCVKPS